MSLSSFYANRQLRTCWDLVGIAKAISVLSSMAYQSSVGNSARALILLRLRKLPSPAPDYQRSEDAYHSSAGVLDNRGGRLGLSHFRSFLPKASRLSSLPARLLRFRQHDPDMLLNGGQRL